MKPDAVGSLAAHKAVKRFLLRKTRRQQRDKTRLLVVWRRRLVVLTYVVARLSKDDARVRTFVAGSRARGLWQSRHFGDEANL